jgi:tRNA (guanine-N7-)-methyltransferase
MNEHPPIRTFSGRRGHITRGQRQAIESLSARYCLGQSAEPLRWEAYFGRTGKRVLEIGFGMGETTAAMAQAMPDHDFLGLEVYSAGVGALMVKLEHLGLTNVRIIHGDAVQVMGSMIETESLDAIHVYFPDPWRKARHHKRRLIQAPFVQQACSRLRIGGYLHCATDWEHYAHQMSEVLHAHAGFVPDPVLGADPIHGKGFSARPPWRPQTKFEARGLRLGHPVWDLVMRRVA